MSRTTIQGHLRTENPAEVRVELVVYDHTAGFWRSVQVCQTNSSGGFRFSGVGPGHYLLLAKGSVLSVVHVPSKPQRTQELGDLFFLGVSDAAFVHRKWLDETPPI